LTESNVEKRAVFQRNSVEQSLKVLFRLSDLFGIKSVPGKILPVFTEIKLGWGAWGGIHSKCNAFCTGSKLFQRSFRGQVLRFRSRVFDR
jgi:hypothetical protein